MNKNNQQTRNDMKLLVVQLFFKKAKNGGICQCVEKENLNQLPIHFKNGSFDPETYQITIEFDDEIKTISLPENFGFEVVEPEKNPDYKGYQRIGVWDHSNMYIFDAQF